MTYDTPFYGSLWLCSSKQHLLYPTLHICDNVSCFMDQLLTLTLFFDHFPHSLITCNFRTYHFPLSTGLHSSSSRRHMSPPYICCGDDSESSIMDESVICHWTLDDERNTYSSGNASWHTAHQFMDHCGYIHQSTTCCYIILRMYATM